MKPGFIYALTHPSDPSLYKIGVTVLKPEKRLAQHNSQFDKYAGKLVKETGQQWELKTYVKVPDTYWAEKAFWDSTPFSLMPGGVSVEIIQMEWEVVEKGMQAAQRAGVRPEVVSKPKKNRAWLEQQLEGTGLTMISPYRNLVVNIEFRCSQNHVFKESPGVVVDRKTCPCCVYWNWLSGPRAGLRPSLR